MSINLSEWLVHLQEEYLTEYIPQGGAAVKVAVTLDEDTETTKSAIMNAARTQRFFAAEINAAITRVHMIQELFFAIARQVDWRGDIDRYLRLLLIQHGIQIEDDQALADIDDIAESNDRLPTDVLREIKSLITKNVLMNYRFCQEFRNAMALLCYAAIDPQSVALTDAEIVMQWLRGEQVNLGDLKRLQIYQRINRHNARLLIRSLSAWQHYVGYNGTALILDLHAILAERNDTETELHYTRGSVLDTYEMLRTFIDDTDELSYLLLVAVIGYGFIDHPRLGQDIYSALKMRLVNEVRDRSRDNPLNAMVSLVLCDGEGDADADSIN